MFVIDISFTADAVLTNLRYSFPESSAIDLAVGSLMSCVELIEESVSVKTVPVAVVDRPVIDTVESNQLTVLPTWSIVAKEMSSAPS